MGAEAVKTLLEMVGVNLDISGSGRLRARWDLHRWARVGRTHITVPRIGSTKCSSAKKDSARANNGSNRAGTKVSKRASGTDALE